MRLGSDITLLCPHGQSQQLRLARRNIWCIWTLAHIYESFADFLADIDSVHKICARVPMNTDMFELTKEIRDVPFACLGMKVMVGNRLGTIVGANDSANFDVQLENGIIANCHPRSNIKYFNRQNELIQIYI